jgi:tRNA G10  N-methylase Trm11
MEFTLPFSVQHHKNTDFAAICVRIPDNALITAECTNLTGGVPDADGFALCQTVEHIPQAAYIRTGLRILAHGSTLDDLLEAVARTDFAAEAFHIDFHSLTRENRVPAQMAIVLLADAIPFYPNLNHPQHRFLLIEREDGLWFGEVVTECKHTYRAHEAKPYNTSSSLPSRMSRALVNLVRLQTRSLLDPCCGTGSILLEAQSLGLQAYGADQNKKMVGMARQNLAYFGYDARIEHADARTYQQIADVLVTNLPYGRFLQADETLIRAILERGVKLAPAAVYVAEHNIVDWLAAAGYRDIAVYPVIKHDGFTRYIHLAHRRGQ